MQELADAVWLWKEHTQGYWGLYDWREESSAWTLSEDAAREVGQPTAHAVPGSIDTLSFDPDQSLLDITLTTAAAGWAQIFAPERWFGAAPAVMLNGKSVEWGPLSAQRYLVLIPEGSHTLRVQ